MSDPNQPADAGSQPYGGGPGQPGQPGQPGPPPQQPGASAPPPPGYQPPYQQGQPGYQQGPAYQPGQAGYQQPYQQAPVSQSDEKTWAMLGHLGGILISFVAGLIVYLVYKDRSAYLRDQGREALNFQITMVIGYLAASILAGITFGLLGFLPFVVWVVQIVFGIIAGLAANRHENYRYPFALRLVK